MLSRIDKILVLTNEFDESYMRLVTHNLRHYDVGATLLRAFENDLHDASMIFSCNIWSQETAPLCCGPLTLNLITRPVFEI